MSEPAQPQQLDSRLSSRRRSRALSLGRWGGGGGNGGGGDAAAGNGDDGDAGNGVAAAAGPRTALPLLNEYAAAKASGVGSKVSELTSFADLSPAIADARFVGPSAEKKARAALASTILPRLAMHEGLPPSLVKPLLSLWHKGRPGGGSHSSSAIASIDAKTSRLALSLAGLLLGPGEAGTPTPLPGAAPPSAAADAGAAEAVRASLAQIPGLDASSADASDPSPGLTEGALRLLASAARGANGGGGSGAAAAAAAAAANSSSSSSSTSPSSKWDADFVAALGVALARGEARAAAFVDANGEAGAAALAALAAAAAEAATEGGASDGGVGGIGGASSSSSSSLTSAKIFGALTSSSSAAKKRAAAAATAVADSSDALHGALAAARASLKGRALRDAALRSSAGAGSADPLCARHALALMASVARGDPARAARAFGLMRGREGSSSKRASSSLSSFDLAAAAATALASYETSALVLGGAAATARTSASGAAAAPLILPFSSSSSSSSSAFSSAPSPTPCLNLDDPLARVSAARLLGAMLFAGIGGGSAAAAVSYASGQGDGGGGASLYSLLSALATRDADDMVALEACKALAGWSGAVGASNAAPFSSSTASPAASNYDNSSSNYTNSNGSLDEASTRDAAARARAFAVLCARARDATVFIPGLVAEEASSGLLTALCSRVRGALGSGNAPLVCAGARAAAALAEAAVRGYDAAVGGGAGGNSSGNDRRAADSAVAAVASLAAPLAGVTRSSSPAEAELALEALLWMQAMPPAPSSSSIDLPLLVVLDAGKVFALAGCLSESLATAALAAARRVLAAAAPRALAPGPAASSAAAPLHATALERTLLVSTALVVGNPSGSRGEATLPELWATAARLGGWRGRAAAARAALAVLEAPCPVLLASSSSSSYSSEASAELAASVADDLAWSGVQQSAAWWLGEHGNAASGEVVGGGGGGAGGGATATTATDASASASGGSGGGISSALSSAPISAALSLASGRSPLLADIVAALQHACAATLPPHARPTAALALCKIAARSDEPYCSSAFGFLVALLGGSAPCSSSSPSPPDPLGVAPFVADAVAALDEVYSSRVALQGLVKARLAELAAEKKEKEKEKQKSDKKKEKNRAGGGASGSDGEEENAAALFDDATLAAVREQHGAVCARLQRLTGLLPDRAYPLGPLSKSLLENGGAELLLQQAAAVESSEGIRRSDEAAGATTSEERVEAERAKLEALLLGGGRAISEVGSSDDEAEVVEARAAAAAAAAADGAGGHRRRDSMAADDDDDSDGGDGGGGGFSTTPPPPRQLLSARSMALSSAAADPLANLTRMLDEQILTGAAAGPTPFASVKQQGGFGAAAAAESSSAAAAADGADGDGGDFSRDALANYGSNDDLASDPPPRTPPYYGADDALARATAAPPRGDGEFGGSLPQQQQQQPLLLGIVEHAFDAALPEELSVVPGSRVRVRGEADGWLDCVLVVGDESPPSRSRSGLVPESHVRYVGDGEFAEAGKKQVEEEKKRKLLLQRQVSESSQLSPQGSLTPRADWLSKPDTLAALVGGGEGSGDGGDGGERAGAAGGPGGRALERQASANPFGGGRQGQPKPSSASVSSPLAASPRALSRRQSDGSGAASASVAAAAAGATAASPSSSNHRAAFAFSAENDDELSVSEGEQLTVLASVDGWVQVENSAGERGLVPESYVIER